MNRARKFLGKLRHMIGDKFNRGVSAAFADRKFTRFDFPREILNSQADFSAIAPSPEHASPWSIEISDVDESAELFGGFLASESIIDSTAIERATRAAQSTGERLDRVLTKLGLISDVDLATALARYLALPIVSPKDLPAEPVLTDVVTPEFVKRNQIMPISVSTDVLIVGVTDPFNLEPVRALAYVAGRNIFVRIFVLADFEKAFHALYLGAEPSDRAPIGGGADANELDVQRLRDIASEAPTIRVVNQLIADAVEHHASDIHIEPTLESVLVRYRIDGLLLNTQVLAPGRRAAITSRIKIMAKLDIGERRMPQDGRIKLAIRGVDIDFRVSTIPTAFGESVVMRILDRSRVELDFAKLGFGAAQIDMLRSLLRHTNGIILVTGPTGSGKTTSLYTALAELHSPERKLFTVEDPIEYQFTGINQVQVQPTIGLSFPHALRSILRQDPDIIMIGEIRDLETARIAVQASLTGHLVLSTLHTNSASGTITRLIDMGIENYLLTSTIKGVLAQRLIRRLCSHCSRPHPEADYWVERLRDKVQKIGEPSLPNIRDAVGCEVCGGHGFVGRSTIAEILMINQDIRHLILQGASDDKIENVARELGMVSMYEDGAAKVWRGETTIDEVMRVSNTK